MLAQICVVVQLYEHVYVCIRTCKDMHAYTCLYTYLCMYIYIHVYIYICIYLYKLYGYIFNTFLSQKMFFSTGGGRGSRKCATPSPVEGVSGFVISSVSFYCGMGVFSCGG